MKNPKQNLIMLTIFINSIFVLLAKGLVAEVSSFSMSDHSTVIQRHLERYPAASIHERGYQHIIFDNHDGTFTMFNSTGHMHYKDLVTDDFTDVDTRLSYNKSTQGWEQKRASYQSHFPGYADEWMTFYDMFEGKSQAMSLKPVAQHVRGEMDAADDLGERAVVYRNAFDRGIDLKLFANNEAMQKLVVIRDASAIAHFEGDIYFDFAIEFPEGLLAIEHFNGQRQWITKDKLDGRVLHNERLLMGGTSLEADDFTYLKKFRVWDADEDKVQFIDVQFYRKDQQWFFRKILKKDFFEGARYPVYTDASSSFFSGTGDGYAEENDSASWDSAHDATTSTGSDDSATTFRVMSFESSSGVQWFIRRGFIPFDTSALDDSAVVISATIDLYTTSIINTDNDGDDFLVIVEGLQASTSNVTTADFDQCGDAIDNPTEGSDRIDISGLTASAYQTFTLDSDGYGWIDPTGFSSFGVREGHDVLDNEIGTDLHNQVRFSTAENSGTSQDPILSVTYSLGPTISGTSDLADTTEIAVAINSTLLSATTTSVSSGAWTIWDTGTINSGDVITVWANGVTDANEATGVTRYDGSGVITGMVLDTHVLSIGSADNQTLTGSMLGLYDNDDDEDIMHALNNSAQGLLVDADNVYSDDELDVLSGDTLTLTGTALSTHDLTINGTLTVSGTMDIDGSWLNNSGNFTHSAGTVRFLATAGSETITSGGDAFNNVLTNDGGGTATWTLADAMDVNGTLRLQGGTLDVSVNDYGIDVGSHWDNEDIFVSRSSTVTLDAGSGTINVTSNGSSFYNLLLADGGGSATFELQDALDVDGTLRIADGTLDVKSGNNFTIHVGSNWINQNIFTARSGTVTFDVNSGTANITSGSSAFNNVVLADGGGGATVEQQAAMTIGGTLRIAGGTWDVSSNNYSLTVGGQWLNEDTFTARNGTVLLNATSGTHDVLSNGSAFYNIEINDGSNTTTFELEDTLTLNGSLFIINGILDTNTTENNPIVISGNWYNDGTFTARNGTVTLGGSDQTIYDSSTFYNLAKTVSSASTLNFEAGQATTITGTMKLKGALGQLLSLRSTASGIQVQINPQGTRDIEYLDIQDSYNTNATAIDATDGTHTNSGNNVMWRFRSQLLSPIMTIE